MRRSGANRFSSLPKIEADFIEPMDCAPVSKLPDGSQWLFEFLCGGPHNISSVASDVMWRWGAVLAKEAHASGPRRHIISIKGFAGTASAQRRPRQSGQKVLATFSIVLGKTHIVASTNMSDFTNLSGLSQVIANQIHRTLRLASGLRFRPGSCRNHPRRRVSPEKSALS